MINLSMESRRMMRRFAAVVVGLFGVLSIVATSGGGGGGDDDEEARTATTEEIAQAKTLTSNFVSIADSLEDIEDPATVFETTIDNAGAVTGKCSAAARDALSAAASNALDLYETNSGTAGTYMFQTDDGLGGAPQSADVVVTNDDPSAGNDTISMTDEMVWGSDGEGGAVLNTVDLEIVLPEDSDTSTSSPLNASINAEIICPENMAGDAGVTLTLSGDLMASRRGGTSGPTLDNIGSLTFAGDIEIAQIASMTVTNPVTIEGAFTLSQSGCTVDDCPNVSLEIDGTLSDSTESTSIQLGISKTATTAMISVGFDADLGGELRGIAMTINANIADEENPVVTSVSIEVAGDDDDDFTIVLDQFNADGEPQRLVVTDGEGGEIVITNLNSDGPIFGTILIDGAVAGTLEEGPSGGLIIRYVDGTTQVFA